MDLFEQSILPETKRIIYSNKQSKSVWGTKVKVAQKLFASFPEMLIQKDLAKISFLIVPKESFVRISNEFAQRGMIVVPVEIEYSKEVYNERKIIGYKCIISKDINAIKKYNECLKVGDQKGIHQLHGIPECCSEFIYKNNCVTDLQWHTANNSNVYVEEVKDIRNVVRVSKDYPKELNTVLLPFGVSLLHYTPCSYDCKASKELAEKIKSFINEGLNDLLDILSLPIEWDCFKGYAVVNTPVFKVVYNSNPTIKQYLVQLDSDFYPEEAPTGLRFPWKRPQKSCGV